MNSTLCIMMAPVAEMTYFDSGTIEHLTVLSLPRSTVMDRSVEEGLRCYARIWEYSREREKEMVLGIKLLSHGLVAVS